MNKTIYQFTKNKRGQLNGVCLAAGKDKFGWSLCKKGDVFNKEFGLSVAMGRALAAHSQNVPHSIRKTFESIHERAQRYYKN